MEGLTPNDCRYFMSLPALMERRGFSFSGSVGFCTSCGGPCILVGLLVGTLILTSGTRELRFADFGCSAGLGCSSCLSSSALGVSLGVSSGVACSDGLGGAGTTLLIPSGPSSPTLFFRRRIRSAAPPGLGLKAVAAFAADAAFQSAPAISFLDFLALIIGPRPGLAS